MKAKSEKPKHYPIRVEIDQLRVVMYLNRLNVMPGYQGSLGLSKLAVETARTFPERLEIGVLHDKVGFGAESLFSV